VRRRCVCGTTGERAISIDDAFGRLRTYARDHNERIHEVARGVVKGETLP
jgi:AmiR/NasT family two-component response regulator